MGVFLFAIAAGMTPVFLLFASGVIGRERPQPGKPPDPPPSGEKRPSS